VWRGWTWLARGELAEKLDVVGRREGLEHGSHLVRASRTGQLTVVVGERVVERSKPPTGCGRVERAVLLEVAPEDERVSAVAVWARREQVARLDDRCARTGRVLCDTQLLFDVLRIDTGSAAGDTRDDRRRPQVHEHVPRLAQHDRLLAPDAVGLGEGDCGVNGIHGGDRRSTRALNRRAGAA